MYPAGWREIVREATYRDASGDASLLDLLAELLATQDQALQILREKGYGHLGKNWLETVTDVPYCEEGR